ncbi:MAG: hypothetical protein ACYCPN_04985 [Thermoplasmata archaeon]
MVDRTLSPSSPRAWDELLRRPVAVRAPGLAWRIVRANDRRALVEIDHRDLPKARSAWEAKDDGPTGPVRSFATWGTLRLGKRWLAQRPAPSARHPTSNRRTPGDARE